MTYIWTSKFLEAIISSPTVDQIGKFLKGLYSADIDSQHSNCQFRRALCYFSYEEAAAGIFGLFMSSLHSSFFFLLLSVPNLYCSFFGYRYYSFNKASTYKSTHHGK